LGLAVEAVKHEEGYSGAILDLLKSESAQGVTIAERVAKSAAESRAKLESCDWHSISASWTAGQALAREDRLAGKLSSKQVAAGLVELLQNGSGDVASGAAWSLADLIQVGRVFLIPLSSKIYG
jgi:hypothetical protein